MFRASTRVIPVLAIVMFGCEAAPVSVVRARDAGAASPTAADARGETDGAGRPTPPDAGSDVGPDAGLSALPDARPDAGPDAASSPTGTCPDALCETVGGLARACGVLAADPDDAGPTAPTCLPVLGPAYSADVRRVRLPHPVPELVAPIEAVIAAHVEPFVLVRPDPVPGTGADPGRFPAYILTGARPTAPAVWAPDPLRTQAVRALAVLAAARQADLQGRDTLGTWDVFPASRPEPPLQLGRWLTAESGATCEARLITVARVTLVAWSEDAGHRMTATAAGCLGSRAAAAVRMDDGARLSDALADALVPVCDTNADGATDGWPVTLDFDLAAIDFDGDASAWVGRVNETPACP